jgi:fructokinase
VIQIGVDFGGTKIEVASLNAAGQFMQRLRAPNPGSYQAAIDTICQLIKEVEEDAHDTGTVGVGVPGSVSPTSGVMRNANSTWLNGRDFKGDLSAAIDRPIKIANDANCFALSEAVDGAAQGEKIVFGVILGTGVGGGLVINGQLIEGAHGIAAECGHFPLPGSIDDVMEPILCWCGQRGCVETLVSGPGLQSDHGSASGEQKSSEEIVSLMRQGDSRAGATFQRFVDRLGRSLSVICNVVDPDVFVFGGGLSNVREIYTALPAVIRSHVFCDAWNGKLVPARWGDSSGVRGAARLWTNA